MHFFPTIEYSEPILKETDTYPKEGPVHHPKVAKKRCMECLYWARVTSPAAFFEQTFQILSRCAHERFTIDTPEPTQTEAPHAVPVFPFSKEWFDPDLPLAQGFLVGLSRLVASNPIQHLLIHTAAEAAPLFAGGTLGFEWAVIAVPGIGAITA